MKTLKSILLGTFIAVGGVALAMNAKTQESICSEIGHDGYSYPQGQTPSLPFNPSAPLPPGMNVLENFNTDYRCNLDEVETCHWIYIPATGGDAARWVKCEGKLERAPFTYK